MNSRVENPSLAGNAPIADLDVTVRDWTFSWLTPQEREAARPVAEAVTTKAGVVGE